MLRMKQRPLSRIVPPTRVLVSGRTEKTRSCFADRPSGLDEWILIYNEAGRSYFKYPGGEIKGHADDVMLIRPGTPHEFGLDKEHGHWKQTWAHFLPRPHCIDWLQWPEFAPGMMHLHLEEAVSEQVRMELYKMDIAAHGRDHRHEEFAVNALERALLLCDSQIMRDDKPRLDARIGKAIDHLTRHPTGHFCVEDLAHRCGLSRARFAELFRKQVGQSPLAFLEQHRLRRARELLHHTSLSLAEVAEQSGFASAYYFSLRFKKHCSVCPSHYRLTVRQK